MGRCWWGSRGAHCRQQVWWPFQGQCGRAELHDSIRLQITRSSGKDLGMYLLRLKENRWESAKYFWGIHTDGKWELKVLERDVKEWAHDVRESENGESPRVGGDIEKHDGHQVMDGVKEPDSSTLDGQHPAQSASQGQKRTTILPWHPCPCCAWGILGVEPTPPVTRAGWEGLFLGFSLHVARMQGPREMPSKKKQVSELWTRVQTGWWRASCN